MSKQRVGPVIVTILENSVLTLYMVIGGQPRRGFFGLKTGRKVLSYYRDASEAVEAFDKETERLHNLAIQQLNDRMGKLDGSITTGQHRGAGRPWQKES